MMTYEQLRECLKIDTLHLDEACSLQADLYLEACELAADMKAAAKTAKANVEVIKSRIQLKYRHGEIPTPIKLTETAILAYVESHDDVVAANAARFEAEKISDKCDGLVLAFDQRRSMLSNETSMHVTGYMQGQAIRSRHELLEDVQKRIVERRKQDGKGRTG